MSSIEKYGFNKHIHSYLTGQLKLSDDKAKAVFAITAGILIYLFNKQIPVYQELYVFQFIGEWGVRILMYLALLFLFISTVISLKVIYPNLTGSKRGYIFFQSISMFPDSNEYSDAIQNLSDETLNEELIKHNYELARVVASKYNNLNRAFLFGTVGFVLMTGYLLVLSLKL